MIGRLIQAYAQIETYTVGILHKAKKASDDKIPPVFSQRLNKAVQQLKQQNSIAASERLAEFAAIAEIRADIVHSVLTVHITSNDIVILQFDPADHLLRAVTKKQRLFTKSNFKSLVFDAEELARHITAEPVPNPNQS